MNRYWENGMQTKYSMEDVPADANVLPGRLHELPDSIGAVEDSCFYDTGVMDEHNEYKVIWLPGKDSVKQLGSKRFPGKVFLFDEKSQRYSDPSIGRLKDYKEGVVDNLPTLTPESKKEMKKGCSLINNFIHNYDTLLEV